MKKTNFLGLKKPDAEDYFNIEDFNENAEIIDEEFKNGITKIGDVKITVRDVSDPDWLLCEDTIISRDEYPALYDTIPSTTDVFLSSWSETTLEYTGTPMLANDGYIYFIGDSSATTASRCKTDLTEYETFDLLKTGSIKYWPQCGYWTVVYNGTAYYSSDCFKTDSNTFDLSDAITSTYLTLSQLLYLGYANNQWYLHYSCKNTSGVSIFRYVAKADSLSEIFKNVNVEAEFGTFEAYGDYDTFDDVRNMAFTKNNGLVISVLMEQGAFGSSGTSRVTYYTDDISKKTLTKIKVLNGLSIYYMTYFEDIDALCMLTNKPYIYSDGSVTSIDISVTEPSKLTHQGNYYYYISDDSKEIVHRVSSIDGTKEASTCSDAVYILSTGSYLYAFGSDSATAIRYIKYGDISIPAALPGTIFKTYIKAK